MGRESCYIETIKNIEKIGLVFSMFFYDVFFMFLGRFEL